MVKYFIITAALLLSGCEQHYRYFCHDPANWTNERCQKPLCEVNRDCPDHIFKGTNGGSNPAAPSSNSFRPSNQTGACK